MAMVPPSKRQKTSPPPHVELGFGDLPDEALAIAATFLPKPSQALLAVAVTAPSPSWRSRGREEGRPTLPAACRVISSADSTLRRETRPDEAWTALDFADVEPGLSRKLSDDDVAAVLICVGAASRLRSLKLTGCVGITGSGLEPLRGSTVLEQFDLSLVGEHLSPNISPEPLMLEDDTIPVLDSIVDAEGNSLKQLQLPKKFRKDEPSQIVEEFVFKYDAFLERLGGECAKCNSEDQCWGHENIQGISWFIDDEESQFYGCQNFTCYKCLRNYCHDCVRYCDGCERAYCDDCVPFHACETWHKGRCQVCWVR